MSAAESSEDGSTLPHRVLTDGPKPKHQQLREILEELCTTQLQPGDMLPGERVLEETYGVSRITVRRAIGDLVASGRLKRARGKGTFVAHAPLVSRLHLASFSAEMAAQNLVATSRILSSSRGAAPDEIAEFFGTDGAPSTSHCAGCVWAITAPMPSTMGGTTPCTPPTFWKMMSTIPSTPSWTACTPYQ